MFETFFFFLRLYILLKDKLYFYFSQMEGSILHRHMYVHFYVSLVKCERILFFLLQMFQNQNTHCHFS